LAHSPEVFVRWSTLQNWCRWSKAPPEQQAFWWDVIDELLPTEMTKADLLQALREMDDNNTGY
jgi:hypothetical protein